MDDQGPWFDTGTSSEQNAAMRYVIVVEADGGGADGGEARLLEGAVDPVDEDYLRNGALPALAIVGAEDARRELAPILQTAARYSYAVDGAQLLWMIEWEPGLVVVRTTEAETLEWVALRSPIPAFGGRRPLPGDVALFEDDPGIEDDNSQYRLVFDPWDAQIDPERRKRFVAVSPETRAAFERGCRILNALTAEPSEDASVGFGEGLRLDREGHPVD